MTPWLERTIARVSPVWAERRARSRASLAAYDQAQQSLMAYDGATTGRRASGWRAHSTSATSEVSAAGPRLRDVSRDMVRNNAYAARAVQAIVTNTVGAGIIPTVSGVDEAARLELEALLVAHFDSVACDADGRHDIYGLQALSMRTMVEAGEVLVRLRPRRASGGLPVPFQLQVLEPEFLDTSKNGPQANGNVIVDGIEFSPTGARVAYHLYTEHPGSLTTWTLPTSRAVPADMVVHLFRVDRPQQIRGVPWSAPVIVRLRDLADYSDAQLVRQKIAACFAAFIATPNEPHLDGAFNGRQSSDSYPVESMEPGMVQRLGIGETVSFGQPPQIDGFSETAIVNLREIAAGFGISYEALTGDLERVNFSSGRMGWLEFQRSIESWRWHTLIPQLCEPVGAWFLRYAAQAVGRRGSEPYAGAKINWTPPRREMIDPTKEIPAASAAIRAGLSSRSYEQRRLGFDPHELDREIADDNDRADLLGLMLDSDGRRMTGAGAAQSADTNDE